MKEGERESIRNILKEEERHENEWLGEERNILGRNMKWERDTHTNKG